MFGYVKPFKPDLKIIEFDTYKSIYCGLCHELGSSFGPFSKFTLSYDFAFLSALLLSLEEESPSFCKERCIANPFTKKACMKENDCTRFSAACAMILFYYKVLDNIKDSGFFKKLCMYCIRPFAASARKKAARQFPDVEEAVKAYFETQQQVESDTACSIDKASDPTGKMLSFIASYRATEEGEKRILTRLGYFLGRWIYIIDAFDDVEDDRKEGNFNPLLTTDSLDDREDTTIRTFATEELNLAAAEVANCYQLLEIKKFRGILDNIIYYGLKESLRQTILKKEKTK